ncbi:CBS domain-containing protein [Sulfurimonas aquatica]|uniref:CBS domain-containing protein n=1 Tax=Sulfurimonas aquatica TaxID=2672570 RepID=A0A975AZK0_9BACT|nr:putative nucleotidyltransferase substrate binding domain-containing protein [Sulfurimonas aquatica]QSZ41472.1 CBS domain-containing protein [Sulfurimonas aquatica]
MSLLDQRKLVESIHPFESLSSSELDDLMGKIDIAYYTKETLLISKDLESIVFYIIIKGSVNEYVDDELHNVYSEGDSFDADALIYSKTESKFVVEEDLICYEIKKDDFLELMQNKKIQSYFLEDFISRHQQLKEHEISNDLSPFLMSKVSEIFLHNVCIVDADESVYNSLKKQRDSQANAIIVKNADEYSIVTDSDLREKVLLGDISVHDSVSKIATKGIIYIDKNDFLFNALLIMTQSNVKRIVVKDAEVIVGILEQIDLLSFFANHSHLVSVRIDKAKSVEDLKELQVDIKNIIVTLRAKGVKVRYITKLVSTLNIKIYKKLFNMCVDQSLREKCTLIVMGSEGREEQTIKTDQDNALIVQNGENIELFEEPMKRLNSYLLELGFPKCKGEIMVSNSFWRRDLSSYKKLIDDWVWSMNEDSIQNISIVMDAKVVAGNASLLEELKAYLHNSLMARADILAHVAKAILNFETPLSLFSGFVTDKKDENRLDLKKGGIFAIVHGVRTLSLEFAIKETNTVERIKKLNDRGIIDKTFAMELIESFDTLSSVRLHAMLEAGSEESYNQINPHKLSKVQRDLLKDSFKVVNRFKKFISFHFHLEMVS